MDHNDVTTTSLPDTEDKLEEQGIEILKLKMEAAIKDREVRKLKAENDALKTEIEKLRIYPISTGAPSRLGASGRAPTFSNNALSGSGQTLSSECTSLNRCIHTLCDDLQ